MSERPDRFVELLRKIFELDKSDLNFGIYRIMNIRKSQIYEFLSKRLPEQVKKAVEHVADNTTEIRRRMDELKKQAAQFNADVEQNEEYKVLKERSQPATDLSALETDVYSYLYNFFNRYYDEGDFISKRRYKEGIYAIPYEGEEVKLYWANQDQYYIKTTENFKDYSFTSDGVSIHFMLVDATTEQNNKENGKKRAFMLFTENEKQPGIKTFEKTDNEFIIRFVYDLSEEKQKEWNDKNYIAIKEYIVRKHDKLIPLITPSITSGKEQISPIQKHLLSYVAKNTFDYFIHKDLGAFLNRELDFFIKNEIMHLDDIDTNKEEHVGNYLAKVRAVKKVGKIIIDFLAQIENFQKRLWLKKKFVIRTDYCITLDKIPEEYYDEIRKNKAQVQEWIDLYAIDEISDNCDLELSEKWTNPPTIKFLKANKKLVIDTKHFNTLFKETIISGIENLDDKTNGVLIHSENFQALNVLKNRYINKVDAIHIDPPYNTDTSGFIYKNSYKHSSWASMIFDRIAMSSILLDKDVGVFQCHIDENEYEFLFNIFDLFAFHNAGTIVWNKLNPILGRKGVATQHEYIIFRTNNLEPVYSVNGNMNRVKEYADLSIKSTNGKITPDTVKKYQEYLNADKSFGGGDTAYRYLDKDGKIYRLVAIGAPEKRTDPKYFMPLLHPVTKKPCPVPPNGWSRTPETMSQLIKDGYIIFGEDETTQPNKKVYLSSDSKRQLPSVLSEGKSGKADLDKLGLVFPYAHPVSMYATLLSINESNLSLDFFAGSGTTGHAVINLNRNDEGNRKYILVEVGDYFNSVTKPRMQKVVYAKDWKEGKPTSRHTGISHIMKYFNLESYEDTLTNIEFSDSPEGKSLVFGDDYLINYMLNVETKGSLLNIEKFREPFDYRLKITEKNEIKETAVDLVETFNYLIGLNVVKNYALRFYKVALNNDKDYEGSVDLKEDKNGDFMFKQLEGHLNDGSRVIIIWRNITDNLLKSNAALDAYFQKSRPNAAERNFDVIYVNGDNNIENLRLDNERWKMRIVETEFMDRMFED